jgi:hypothetical protein
LGLFLLVKAEDGCGFKAEEGGGASIQRSFIVLLIMFVETQIWMRIGAIPRRPKAAKLFLVVPLRIEDVANMAWLWLCLDLVDYWTEESSRR